MTPAATDPVCVVCTHRRPHRGWVCEVCRSRLRVQLADLPRMLSRLEVELTPTQTTAGERVVTSRVGSPTGARLDVLTLTGPGAQDLTDPVVQHPLMRRWSTTIEVDITVAGRMQRRTIREWHSEPVCDDDGNPVLVAANDQVGLLPPVEWLDSWSLVWREHFGHSVRERTRGPRRRLTDRQVRAALIRTAATPTGAPLIAWLLAVRRMWRQHAINAVLGLGGYQNPGDRPADPLAYEWEIRWGPSSVSDNPAYTLKYLLAWLDDACDDDVGIRDFAAELRSLTAELGRVIGEVSDLNWLGRCPAQITDPNNPADSRRCGAGLWQDPYTGTFHDGVFVQEYPVICPRCRTTWGPKRLELHQLAKQIRQVWPLDRRRRYARDEVSRLVLPSCPGCGRRVQVKWRNVTGRRDRDTWWTLEKITCPALCADAERIG